LTKKFVNRHRLGANLVEKIKKTENIDKFETDIVDALDASKLGRYFRKDQTKILFGDVIDGELVLGPECNSNLSPSLNNRIKFSVSNVFSKSLDVVTDIVRMENYNSPEILEIEAELIAPSAPGPTEKTTIVSIEPEFDSEIVEDTVIPELNHDLVKNGSDLFKNHNLEKL